MIFRHKYFALTLILNSISYGAPSKKANDLFMSGQRHRSSPTSNFGFNPAIRLAGTTNFLQNNPSTHELPGMLDQTCRDVQMEDATVGKQSAGTLGVKARHHSKTMILSHNFSQKSVPIKDFILDPSKETVRVSSRDSITDLFMPISENKTGGAYSQVYPAILIKRPSSLESSHNQTWNLLNMVNKELKPSSPFIRYQHHHLDPMSMTCCSPQTKSNQASSSSSSRIKKYVSPVNYQWKSPSSNTDSNRSTSVGCEIPDVSLQSTPQSHVSVNPDCEIPPLQLPSSAIEISASPVLDGSQFDASNDYDPLFAIKEVKINDEFDLNWFRNEIKILKMIQKTPGVVQYFGSFENCEPDHTGKIKGTGWIITNWVGNFLEEPDLGRAFHSGRVDKLAINMKEDLVRSLFHQLLLALKSLHAKNIIHGDIKPANILVSYPDECARPSNMEGETCIDASPLSSTKTMDVVEPESSPALTLNEDPFEDIGERCSIAVKRMKPMKNLLQANFILADFGNSQIPESSARGMCDARVCTCEYQSPEMARGMAYSVKHDIFSLGIVGYYVIFGTTPFAITENMLESLMRRTKMTRRDAFCMAEDDLNRKIGSLKEPLVLPAEISSHLSSDFISVLKHMLHPEEKLRYTSEQLLEHDFFNPLKYQQFSAISTETASESLCTGPHPHGQGFIVSMSQSGGGQPAWQLQSDVEGGSIFSLEIQAEDEEMQDNIDVMMRID